MFPFVDPARGTFAKFRKVRWHMYLPMELWRHGISPSSSLASSEKLGHRKPQLVCGDQAQGHDLEKFDIVVERQHCGACIGAGAGALDDSRREAGDDWQQGQAF